MNSTASLGLGLKLGWATAEIGIATFIGITMVYLLYYLTEVLLIPPGWAGIALLIPRLWDVAIDPMIGAISDRTVSPMGRRRPYLLIGALTFGPLFALIFFCATPEAPLLLKFSAVTAVYMVSSTAYSLNEVPYTAMAAEFTSDYAERTSLTSYRLIAARLGIVLAVTAGPLLFMSGANRVIGFQRLGVVGGLLIMVTGFVTFFATRRAPRIERQLHQPELREEFRAVLENRPFRALWWTFLAQNIAIGASASALIYMVTFVMRASPALVGPLVASTAIVSLLITPAWVKVSRRLGKQRAYHLAIGIMIVTSLPVLVLPAGWYLVLFVILMVSGLGDAGVQLCPSSMVPDTVEVDEMQTGHRREGVVFGSWSLCRKLGMALGAFIVSISLVVFGFVQGVPFDQQSDGTLFGIRVVYALIPGGLWIIAALLLRRYDLSEHRFNELKLQIQQRKMG